MEPTCQRDVRRGNPPGVTPWLMVVTALVAVIALSIIAVKWTGTHRSPSSGPTTRGSGTSITDRREVSPFASVELAGANTVAIQVGASASVAVIGDDNLVGRITTVVRSGRLVIDNTGNFSTKAPMRVVVATPSLTSVELSGAGTVTVDGVTGGDFRARLTGQGTVTVSGIVQRIDAVLAGAGTLDLRDLRATDGTAQLLGTGTLRVQATARLEATLSGTGTILYRGNPTVTTHSTGTGTVAPE